MSKPITFAAAAFVLAVATLAYAATDASKQAQIDRAMQAAPASITENAMIMASDGAMLREGSNGWTCMPDSGPGSSHPMCNDAVWMELMTAVASNAPFKTTRIGISYMLAGDDNVNNADPFDTHQDPGEVWVQEGPHLMIVVPSEALEGLSDDPNNGGPYVMWKDTPYAHIMVPVAPRTGQ